MSNADIERDVLDELAWDPEVADAAVAVRADRGTVTLRGTLGSLRDRRAAANAAMRVRGVRRVENELQVRILSGGRRADANVRGSVLRALVASGAPATVNAKVLDRVVTLSGTVATEVQRSEAELVARGTPGVLAVVNEIYLAAPAPYSGDIEQSIRDAFVRQARLDAVSVRAESSDGTVTLTGVVESWSEHDAAVAAAWASPGVTSVVDELVVDDEHAA